MFERHRRKCKYRAIKLVAATECLMLVREKNDKLGTIYYQFKATVRDRKQL